MRIYASQINQVKASVFRGNHGDLFFGFIEEGLERSSIPSELSEVTSDRCGYRLFVPIFPKGTTAARRAVINRRLAKIADCVFVEPCFE